MNCSYVLEFKVMSKAFYIDYFTFNDTVTSFGVQTGQD